VVGTTIGVRNTGALTMTNVTVSTNSAVLGSAAGVSNSGTAILTSVTIAENANPPGPGFGITNSGSLQLHNTVLSNNGTNCSGIPVASLGYNLSSDGTCGLAGPGDLSNEDSRLGPLQGNGGPTQTHALLPDSPAIDAGNPVSGCSATDQRGQPRPIDGDGDGVGRCDIGAIEARGPLVVSTGVGAGGGPHVRLFRVDGAGGATAIGPGFMAYDPAFTGGVQATLVEVGGDLFVVTGVGVGGGPHVRLFKVTDPVVGTVVPVGPGFMAYAPAFTGGVRVAATTDTGGNLLIITAPGPGGGPHVRVFRVTSLDTGEVEAVGDGFFAYAPAFSGGVNVGAE
jgi:hypothetical protein